jgi:hypothetical protein
MLAIFIFFILGFYLARASGSSPVLVEIMCRRKPVGA